MKLNWNTEKAGAAFVLANGDHGAAERRAQDQCHQRDGDREADEREVVEIGVVVSGSATGLGVGYRADLMDASNSEPVHPASV